MRAWFKRNAAPASREQLVEIESKTLSTVEKVQRLVARHGTDSGTANELARGFTQTYVIVVACQKGGAGKTTIAAHLAVQAVRAGHGPVVLVDTDPQGSLGEWRSERKDDAPALATANLADLAANPAELWSGKAAFAIIDTPPALTASIERVIAIADLVLIPARPSPHDLRAIGT